MDFVLFLLVNLTLFVRPGELIPALGDIRIYNYLIIAALVAAAPRIIEQLRPARMSAQPITACVLGLVPALVLSHASHMDSYLIESNLPKFLKSVLYFLLLVAVVNTSRRLQLFFQWITIFAAVACGIAVLNYFEIITIESLVFIDEKVTDETTGIRVIAVRRLCGTGIFNDPNDLAMIAVLGTVVCSFALQERTFGAMRFFWAGPLVLFVVTIGLTRSRGGLLALLAGLGALFYHRYGLKKAMLAGGLLVPVALLVLGGRQTDVSGALSSGTGAARVQLWSEGIQLFKEAPIFGIGYGQYDKEASQVAHNSFLHCFAELGLFGGTLFLGAFWFSVHSVWILGRRDSLHAQVLPDPILRRMAPLLMGLVGGWCISMMSLSRQYVVPTYMVLGLVATYCLQVERLGLPPVIRLNAVQMRRVAFGSVAFLASIYVFIRVILR